MRIVRVVGTTISTIKDAQLTGRKLLLVREADETGKVYGKPLVAVDTVDAGIGDLVLIAQGSSARMTDFTHERPIDAVIMAVIDSLEIGGKVTYRKE